MAQMNIDLNNRIFMRDPSGIAVASLGQLVEGYAVAFGHEDKINLLSLERSERCEFLEFVRNVRERVQKHFGRTIMFEHGAVCAGTAVSCGVNRVHVHVVPYNRDTLTNEIKREFQCIASASTIEEMLDELRSWDTARPYFWIEEGGKVFLFSYGEHRQSQAVRRVLARKLGIADRWDWRTHPTVETAERIAKELATVCSGDRLHAAAV